MKGEPFWRCVRVRSVQLFKLGDERVRNGYFQAPTQKAMALSCAPG